MPSIMTETRRELKLQESVEVGGTGAGVGGLGAGVGRRVGVGGVGVDGVGGVGPSTHVSKSIDPKEESVKIPQTII